MIATLALALALALAPQVVRDLGTIDFPNSGAAEAQEDFLRGALLLHSFEYEDAAEAFRAAQELDPDFVLAYWGEALTHSHPIWSEDDPEAAREVLARLAPTREERLARAPGGRERGLLESVEILFGEGTMLARNRAYERCLGRLAARFPDDLEIASFHGLSILGTVAGVRDVPTYMRAAAVCERVYERNPRHPGALHYLIHSYDDPVHAPLGLRMADTYAQVAPAAAHALHMPSHIYVALGMWDASAASNEASSAAADARLERKGLTIEDRGYHALLWLAYTYLQQGRFGAAERLLEDMERDAAESGSELTRYHLADMRAHHVVHSEDGEDTAAGMEVDTDELGVAIVAADRFADGLVALRTGRTADAEAALDALRARRAAPTQEDEGPVGCCLPAPGSPGVAAVSPARQAALVMELELEGLLALERGATEDALALLAEAVAAEGAQPMDFGPPTVVKPAHELRGEVLLGLGRADEARAAFEAALARAPNRALSLRGLARSADRAGDAEQARETWRALAAQWHAADPDAALLEEIRRGARDDG